MEEGDFWARFSAFRKVVNRQRITTVAIAGYYRPELMAMLIWSRLTGRKVVLFAESWYGGNALTDKIKGFLLNILCHQFFVSGKRAAEHFEGRLALPARKIKKGYSVVDNAYFEQARPLRKQENDLQKRILCVARFSPEKNLKSLLVAFSNSGLSKNGWQLRVVGGGPQKEELKTLAKDIQGVELQDWVSHLELPKLYSQASLFVLPSIFEPWGLVVNEAISAGLFCICSDSVGAVPDLINRNSGLVYETEGVQSLTESLISGVQWAEGQGRKVDTLIDPYTLVDWANTITHLARI
jgi:glycosyltransferase involved in cell wall biosynthesis